MHWILPLFTLIASLLYADPADLHARRIMMLWETKNETLALQEAKGFVQEHPDHHLTSTFYLLLAEEALKKEAWQESFEMIHRVSDPIIANKAQPIIAECLYRLGNMDQLYDYFVKAPPLTPYATLFFAEVLMHSEKAKTTLEQKDRLHQAHKAYLSLKNTDQRFLAEKGLALIEEEQQLYPKAAARYHNLALHYPEHKIEAIYQKARLTEHFASLEAIESYALLLKEAPSDYTKAAAHAYSRLLLENLPERLLREKETLKPFLLDNTEEYVAHASFYTKDYKEALPLLRNLVLRGKPSPSLLEEGMISAYYQGLLADFLFFYNTFDSKSAFYPEALYMKGSLLLQANKKECLQDFELLIKNNPDFRLKNRAQIHLAQSNLLNGKYFEARDELVELLQRELSPEDRLELLKTLFSTSLKILSKKSLAQEQKALTLAAIEKAMAQGRAFHNELSIAFTEGLGILKKKEDFRYLLRRCAPYAQIYPKIIAEIHKRLAFMEYEEQNLDQYRFHLKKALLLTKDTEAEYYLILQLYNEALSKNNSQDALRYLHQIALRHPQNLPFEHLKWALAYTKQQIDTFSPFVFEKTDYTPSERKLLLIAQDLYQLGIKQDGSLKNYLAKIYLMLDKPQASKNLLLEDLVSNEQKYLLAIAEKCLGNKNQATALLQELIEKEQGFIPSTTKLKALYLLGMSENSPDSKEMLQKVWQYKSASSEPMHLKAALAWLEDAKKDKKLENLIEIKKAFSSAQTLQDKDYFNKLSENPTKLSLYQNYMLYLDWQIAHLEAEVAKNQGDSFKAELKQKRAEALYQSLHKQSVSLPKELREQLNTFPS